MSDIETVRYFNEMMARFEALLYHELSGTAHIDLIQSKDIQGKTIEEIIDHCIREIISMGIVKDMNYTIHGYGILIKFEVDGCIHIPKETKLRNDGVSPYFCPIANMIGDRIIEILNYEVTYLANMDIDEENRKCIVKYAVFETPEMIGQVSDWTKI